MISHTTPRSDLKTISMGHSTGYNEMKELQQKCCLTFQHSRSCHSQQICHIRRTFKEISIFETVFIAFAFLVLSISGKNPLH